METIGNLHRKAGVDKTHLRGQKEIKRWRCPKCNYLTNAIDKIGAEPSLGTWGPNGNGWLYWCPQCEHALNIEV